VRERVLTIVLSLAAAGQAHAQTPSSPAGPLTYAAAVDRALAANPAIAAARLRRSIGIASRDVAAERLNPEFRAEFARETPKEAYTVSWPWEIGGKRERRVAVADAAIATGDAELEATIAGVSADVRRAFFDRYVAESRQALLAEVQGLAQRARDAAQARFDTGDAPRLEVLQADLALADAQNQAAAAAGSVTAARVALNALLAYPLDSPTPIDMSLDVEPSLAPGVALARARQGNVELRVLDRRIAEQQARVTLAQALRQPDLTPEAALTHRAEPDFTFGWRAAVAVSVPILATHKPGVVVEEATLTQLISERAATEARIASAVLAATAVAEAQRQQYIRYRDEIAPQALEVERMADDSYRLGQTAIAAYLQSLQATRDVRLRALQAVADLQNALADLERAIGAPPSSGAPANGPAAP
jgi:cobalt-zinc-cadmium efflux system outer membrane protein